MTRTTIKITSFFIVSLFLLAVAAPWLPLHSPFAQNIAEEYAAPSSEHLFGLGENGVDVLSQVLWATRTAFVVSFGSVFIAAILGLTVGSLAAFRGGWFDIILMRIIDVLYAFPGILLVVALAFILGPSLKNLILVLVITSWASYAKLARAQTLSLRERDFVQAAVSQGATSWKVIVHHIWPNLWAPLTVQMTYGMGAAIMAESSLSFLGLANTSGTASWGLLLNQGRDVMSTATHLVMAPGIFLVLTVLAFNFLGDALRDYFDPKFNVHRS